MARFSLPSELLKARLSRRIIFWVFLSIVVIEAIILVPSVYRRERELLNYLKALSAAQANGILAARDLGTMGTAPLLNYLGRLESNPAVKGGALYSQSGQLVGTFGEPPRLTWPQIQAGRTDHYWRRQRRYDALWESMSELEDDYLLVIRHDATWVQQEFYSFIGRITGLVLIISVFVTGATMVVLERLLIKPVLRLRQDLLAAGKAIHEDQQVRNLTCTTYRNRQDELGDVIAAFNTMLSQIEEAIATRKQSEDRFRALVEQAVDAFYVVNRQGNIINVNQQACDSLGYSREELMALKVGDIQQDFTQADLTKVWQQLQPNRPISREGCHLRKDGSQFPVEVRIGLLQGRDEELILALVRDVTERKQAEQALARLAEIGELAAMIVHEVRSPLTTVLMGLMSFRQMELSERAQRRLTLALEESERLQMLLNEILQYAREPTLDAGLFDLNALVHELVGILGEMPAIKDHALNLTLPPGSVIVEGDANKLKQVFINLVVNACEASPAGESVTWQVAIGSRNQITITIHNQGEPIPPEILPKLMHPFFTTKSSGNGLGLAITKRIVEAHKGQIEFSSSAEAGTVVTVTLPRVQSTQARSQL
ncbi:PAS domain-containing sensor histidine kinase [filamentous cyanobacterium CCP5]|nr:PAS domain-containing sensor histidine kinase [filamentous cyanobacterium CCP5]